MSQWHFSIDGNQVGPMDDASARQFAAGNPQAFCWRPGFSNWQLVSATAELLAAPVAATAGLAPPPGRPRVADEIDFEIRGEDLQYVEVELDPGESAVAEAGSMMYKDSIIEMHTIFGDGSGQDAGAGFMDKLIGAGKRVLTGESLFTTVFTHEGHAGKAHVAFAAPFPGTILALKLSEYNHRLICQKDSFLAAAKGVQIGIHFQRKILTGLFGGEGFIMQKLEGDGWVFIHFGGKLYERDLKAGEVLHVDTGCLAAITETVDYDIMQAGGIKSMLFGGEGLFFARLQGPGHVWLQSLPFSRLAGRMLTAAPQRGGSRGEGSVLGGLGDLFGDSR
ncbi:MAG: TIGR00266 family protein [Geminicoccaceae bacterium]|nr:TIGR00266 family protein [Geminicoccaceae bacterium]MCB2011323.1 TIGR00266 family protein [Geminicoccaceae bacterium]